MRKKNENLQEELLECAKNILLSEGADAVTVRAIAKQTGVAVGTVYNYFEDKDDLLLAITEQYWSNTLTTMQSSVTSAQFAVQAKEIFLFLRQEIGRSGRQIMSSLSGAPKVNQQRMSMMQQRLETIVLTCLQQDTTIAKETWTQAFTMEGYAHFVTQNIILHLRTPNGNIDFLQEIIQRTLVTK